MSTKDVNTMRIAPKVWRNGEFIDWDNARVHVMTHAIHYGSSVFEGIRAYKTERGTAVFRLTEHIQRLLNSAKVYRMDVKFNREEFARRRLKFVRGSGMEECYIRPIIFRGLNEEKPAFGVNPFPNPIDCYIAAWDWGKYLGEEALETGVDVCVSSWTRITSNSLPAVAKAGANYMNSQLIKMEAILGGFSEGIALDDRGYVSEGSGENIFLVNNGKLDHAAARRFDSAGHHARFGYSNRPRTRNRSRTKLHSARRFISGRRIIFHRHSRRNHADSFG
jgi:branched-chain amino acid aminotransferase